MFFIWRCLEFWLILINIILVKEVQVRNKETNLERDYNEAK